MKWKVPEILRGKANPDVSAIDSAVYCAKALFLRMYAWQLKM